MPKIVRPPTGVSTTFDPSTWKTYLRCAASSNAFAVVSVQQENKDTTSKVNFTIYRTNKLLDPDNRLLSAFQWESQPGEEVLSVNTYEHLGQLLASLQLKQGENTREVSLMVYTQYIPVVINLKEPGATTDTELTLGIEGTSTSTSVGLKLVAKPSAVVPSVLKKAQVFEKTDQTLNLEELLGVDSTRSHSYSAYIRPSSGRYLKFELGNRLRRVGTSNFANPVGGPVELLVCRGELRAAAYSNSSNKNNSQVLVFRERGDGGQLLYNVSHAYKLGVLEMAAEQGPSGEDGVLLAYSFAWPGYNQVELRLLKRGLVASFQLEPDFALPGTVQTLKLVSLTTPKLYLLLVKRVANDSVRVVQISTAGDKISAKQVAWLQSVTAVSYCRQRAAPVRVFALATPSTPPRLDVYSFDAESGSILPTVHKFTPTPFRIRNLAAFEATPSIRDDCSLVLDLDGPSLLELGFDGALHSIFSFVD